MDRFLSLKQVRDKTSISQRQLGRLIERGQFPKPIPLYEDGRRKGFRESEVDKWMAARVEARDRGAAPQPAAGNGHQSTAPSSSRSRGRIEPEASPPPASRRGRPRQAQPLPRGRPRRASPRVLL